MRGVVLARWEIEALKQGRKTILRVPYYPYYDKVKPAWTIHDMSLYVKESYAVVWHTEEPPDPDYHTPKQIRAWERSCRTQYRADETVDTKFPGDWPNDTDPKVWGVPRWLSAQTMPRYRSRFELRVLYAYPQKLGDLKEHHVKAEGFGNPITRDCKVPKYLETWYQRYGNIYGDDPDVRTWAITFEVVPNAG